MMWEEFVRADAEAARANRRLDRAENEYLEVLESSRCRDEGEGG